MSIKSFLPRRALFSFCALIFLLLLSIVVVGQTSPTAQPSPSPSPPASQLSQSPKPSLEKEFFKNILRDQRDIWLAPFHLHGSDAKWAAPLAISTITLMATDRHTSGELVENGDNLDRLRISKDISRLGSWYVTGGIAAGFYFTGKLAHDDRARETGLLGAEALIDSGIVVQVLKTASQRQRPPVDNSSGEFFDGGSSFPSGHAIASWALATVVAEEYGQHRPLVRFGAYGLATAISISRFTGRNHFLSDVLIGSAMGYGIGRYVYHQHHDSALDSSAKTKISRLTQSSLFPRIDPVYNPRARLYGAGLHWNF